MTIAPFAASENAGGDVTRWTASFILVLVLHGLGAAALLTWRSSVDLQPPVPAAIMIELAPLPVPVPPVIEPPTPPPELERQFIPEPLPSPAPRPEVVLPPPKPKIVHKVTPPPPKQEVVQSPLAPPPAQPPQQAVAPTVARPPAATPSYQGLLMAQLERNKRYPREARMRHQEGVATLRFTLSRDGGLLAFKLEHSSGFPALDEEVLAMIRRAAPLPPFPADMPQATMELVVPVRFSLR